MSQETSEKRTRLNVAVDEPLHRELRLLAAETHEPLTVLVPRLLRGAVRQERERLARQ